MFRLRSPYTPETGPSVHGRRFRAGMVHPQDQGDYRRASGHEVSASTISRLDVKLDEELERFATRRLSEAYPYLILDARYEKVREDG